MGCNEELVKVSGGGYQELAVPGDGPRRHCAGAGHYCQLITPSDQHCVS
jgi:hypothetical protein